MPLLEGRRFGFITLGSAALKAPSSAANAVSSVTDPFISIAQLLDIVKDIYFPKTCCGAAVIRRGPPETPDHQACRKWRIGCKIKQRKRPLQQLIYSRQGQTTLPSIKKVGQSGKSDTSTTIDYSTTPSTKSQEVISRDPDRSQNSDAAPVWYSQMSRFTDGIRLDKVGANGVIAGPSKSDQKKQKRHHPIPADSAKALSLTPRMKPLV